VTGEVAATPTGAIRWGGGRNGPWNTRVNTSLVIPWLA